MKRILILTLSTVLLALPGWSQTASPTPSGGGSGGELLAKLQAMTPAERQAFLKNHPEIRERLRERCRQLLEKLQGMTPEQREQFLQNHPRIQQFINNHPKFARKLSNG